MKKVFIFPFLLLLFSQCGEDEYVPPKELPPITTTGENTFACKINGENWQVGQKNTGPDLRVDASIGDAFVVYASNDDSNEVISLWIPIEAIDGQAINMNWPPPPPTLSVSQYTSGNECEEFGLSADEYAMSGTLQVVHYEWLDNYYRVISGTFEFTFYNLVCGDTTRITDGRFDIRF